MRLARSPAATASTSCRAWPRAPSTSSTSTRPFGPGGAGRDRLAPPATTMRGPAASTAYLAWLRPPLAECTASCAPTGRCSCTSTGARRTTPRCALDEIFGAAGLPQRDRLALRARRRRPARRVRAQARHASSSTPAARPTASAPSAARSPPRWTRKYAHVDEQAAATRTPTAGATTCRAASVSTPSGRSRRIAPGARRAYRLPDAEARGAARAHRRRPRPSRQTSCSTRSCGSGTAPSRSARPGCGPSAATGRWRPSSCGGTAQAALDGRPASGPSPRTDLPSGLP